MATITVLADMSTAPRAGVRRIPQAARTPAWRMVSGEAGARRAIGELFRGAERSRHEQITDLAHGPAALRRGNRAPKREARPCQPG
jgi:hypothetical protein